MPTNLDEKPSNRFFCRFFSYSLIACFFLLGASPIPADPGAASDEWTTVRSEHFEIFNQASPERGREIARRLEHFRALFARLAPALELTSPAPIKIYAFRDADSYAPFKAGRDAPGSITLGQFLSHPEASYLTIDAGTRAAGAFGVVQHELVHYFVKHNFPSVPLWFNEGLAEYYSTFELERDGEDGRKMVLGRPVERHLRWLRQGEDLRLDEVLRAGARRVGDDGHGVEATGRFYAVSWLLVHQLLSGGDQRIDQMIDYLWRLQDGEDSDDAFEQAFGVRLSQAEEILRRAVARGRFDAAEIPLRGARVKVRVGPTAAADAAYHLGDLASRLQSPQAENLYHRALYENPRHPEAHAGLADLRGEQERWEEAEWLFRDAWTVGSEDPVAHLRFARHNLRLLQHDVEIDPDRLDEPLTTIEIAERGRNALRRAIEIEPDYAEAWTLLGAMHRIEGDLYEGLEALDRARELMPERRDVPYYRAQLLLTHERYDDAEQVVERTLTPTTATDAAWLERVEALREEIVRRRLVAQAQAALEEEEWEEAIRLYDEAIEATSDPAMRAQMEEVLERLKEQGEG